MAIAMATLLLLLVVLDVGGRRQHAWHAHQLELQQQHRIGVPHGSSAPKQTTLTQLHRNVPGSRGRTSCNVVSAALRGVSAAPCGGRAGDAASAAAAAAVVAAAAARAPSCPAAIAASRCASRPFAVMEWHASDVVVR